MPTRDEAVAHTNAALADLVRHGKGTATGIANWLSDRGITGFRQNACDCPISNYLARETTTPHTVGPGQCSPLVWDDDQPAKPTPHIPLPDPVAQFVRLFDSGVYPDLDRDKFPKEAAA